MTRTSKLLLALPISIALTGCGGADGAGAQVPAPPPRLALSVDTSPVAVGATKTYTLRWDAPDASVPSRRIIRVADVSVEDSADPAAAIEQSATVGDDGTATFALVGLHEGVVRLSLRAGDGRGSLLDGDVGEAVLPVVVADGADVRDCVGPDPRDGLLRGSETDCVFTALYSGEPSGDVVPASEGGITVEPIEAERVRILATEPGRAALTVPGTPDARLPIDVVAEDEVRQIALVDARTGAALGDASGSMDAIVAAHLAPGESLAVHTQAITADGRKLTGALDRLFTAGAPDVLDARDDAHALELHAGRAGIGWLGGDVGRYWQLVVTVG